MDLNAEVDQLVRQWHTWIPLIMQYGSRVLLALVTLAVGWWIINKVSARLGKLVGLSRQTVNRVLRELATRGIIAMDHGRVLIRCDAALGRYLAGAEDIADTSALPPQPTV